MSTYDVTTKVTVRVEFADSVTMALSASDTALAAISDEFDDGSKAHFIDSEIVKVEKL